MSNEGKKIKESKDFGAKKYFIYLFGANDFRISQQNLQMAEIIDDNTREENLFENNFKEEPINNIHYSSVEEAEKALFEHIGVTKLDWL